ncbi:hypothetical protein D3C72_2433190 [compost metagenome]
MSALRQKNCSDDAGKSAAAAKIDPMFRVRSNLEDLGTVGDVSLPEIGLGRGGHKIDGGRPFLEQTRKTFELIEGFT